MDLTVATPPPDEDVLNDNETQQQHDAQSLTDSLDQSSSLLPPPVITQDGDGIGNDEDEAFIYDPPPISLSIPTPAVAEGFFGDPGDPENDDRNHEITTPQAQRQKQQPITTKEKSERIQVLIRIKPLFDDALDRSVKVGDASSPNQPKSSSTSTSGSSSAFTKLNKQKLPNELSIITRDKKGWLSFNFDAVVGETGSQQDVFQLISPAIEQVVSGINTTVFAYGQTGTGKTHTMLGEGLEQQVTKKLSWKQMRADMTKNEEGWGVIPRSLHLLFASLSKQGMRPNSKQRKKSIIGIAEVNDTMTKRTAGTKNFSVMCSYMQIYNDQLYDLLTDEKDNKGNFKALPIREGTTAQGGRNLYVQGLSEYRVSTADDVLALLFQGGRNRAVRATEYNQQSSRSHAILQLSVEIEIPEEDSRTIVRKAKLNLVDLAGSEKWGTFAGEKDVDMKLELRKINSSLSALGLCISALADKRRSHVPYRDSPLTRLLQDSLGGGTRTVVIATVSAKMDAQEESASTLQFANRANRVDAKIKINEVVNDAVLLKRAQREISRLKQKLAEALDQAGRQNSTQQVTPPMSRRVRDATPDESKNDSRTSSASAISKEGENNQPKQTEQREQQQQQQQQQQRNQHQEMKPPRTGRRKSLGKQNFNSSKNINVNNSLDQSFGASMTEQELQKLSAITTSDGQNQLALAGQPNNQLIAKLESKFEKREADLLKEIDSLRSMVLGIVDDKTEKESENKVEEIRNIEIDKFKDEVSQLKSSKESMEVMVVEMRNHLKEMQNKINSADEKTSDLIQKMQKGQMDQKQLETEMEALLRIKGDVDFERKMAQSQERLASLGVITSPAHRMRSKQLSGEAEAASGSEAIKRVMSHLNDDAKKMLIEASSPSVHTTIATHVGQVGQYSPSSKTPLASRVSVSPSQHRLTTLKIDPASSSYYIPKTTNFAVPPKDISSDADDSNFSSRELERLEARLKTPPLAKDPEVIKYAKDVSDGESKDYDNDGIARNDYTVRDDDTPRDKHTARNDSTVPDPNTSRGKEELLDFPTANSSSISNSAKNFNMSALEAANRVLLNDNTTSSSPTLSNFLSKAADDIDDHGNDNHHDDDDDALEVADDDILEQSAKSNMGGDHSISQSGFFLADDDPSAMFNKPAKPVSVPNAVTKLDLTNATPNKNKTIMKVKTISANTQKISEANANNSSVLEEVVKSDDSDDEEAVGGDAHVDGEGDDGSDSERQNNNNDDRPITTTSVASKVTSEGSTDDEMKGIVDDPKELQKTESTPLASDEEHSYSTNANNSVRPTSVLSFRPGSTRPMSTRPMSTTNSFRRGSLRTPATLRGKTPSTSRPPPTREGDVSRSVICLATVKFDFVAEEQDDLAMKAGTVIQVIEKCESGWWRGKYENGKLGVFPSNFVSVIEATEHMAKKNAERDRHKAIQSNSISKSFAMKSNKSSKSAASAVSGTSVDSTEFRELEEEEELKKEAEAAMANAAKAEGFDLEGGKDAVDEKSAEDSATTAFAGAMAGAAEHSPPKPPLPTKFTSDNVFGTTPPKATSAAANGVSHISPNQYNSMQISNSQQVLKALPEKEKEKEEELKQQKQTEAFLNSDNEACERHGLTRCVLCSLTLSSMTSSTSATAVAKPGLQPLPKSSTDKENIDLHMSKNLSSLNELKSNTTQLKSMSSSLPNQKLSHPSPDNIFNSVSSILTSSTLGGSSSVTNKKPCERHFLMNCVLCSRNIMEQASAQQSPLKISQASPLVKNSGDQLCDRHNLKNCFLCNLQQKQATQPDMFSQGTSNNNSTAVRTNMQQQHQHPQQFSQDAYATYNAMKASPPINNNNSSTNNYNGISLGSIPYSANTGLLGMGIGGNIGSAGMGFSPPHQSHNMYSHQLPHMQQMQSPQQNETYQFGNGAGISPDVHGRPVDQPSTANPIPMDKYQFGNEPTLNLGFSTTRSIASPGASSTYSQERMMTADSYGSGVASIDEEDEDDDKRGNQNGGGDKDDDDGNDDDDDDPHETSVTWNEAEIKRQQGSKQNYGDGGGKKRGYMNATKQLRGSGGGSDGSGSKKSNITYAKNWDGGSNGNNNNNSNSSAKKKNASGNANRGSAYNVGVKKLKAQRERQLKAMREGPKKNDNGGKRKAPAKAKKSGEGGDTLSRARMAIESASEILLDVGPA